MVTALRPKIWKLAIATQHRADDPRLSERQSLRRPHPVGRDVCRTVVWVVQLTYNDQNCAVPLRRKSDAVPLAFLSTTTVFGTATDVMLSEVTIEAFFLADDRTPGQ
ncbi:hypothetical protein [Paracoccus saliphilus]|uniref:Uncharacterized protein n=1 Tax=Paracoccus saliphilus TaxID=405559 RepID=A0AA46A7R3_9RHOB|nr:hypothetical protein [Paracoccus saliphilus]WCR02674.1 hypothetical protein JHX88_17770 [Paracoccus saliphilus]SIT17372.1 hypothetical protein SAMN05421772_1314 [Paracoccus saliphilus]